MIALLVLLRQDWVAAMDGVSGPTICAILILGAVMSSLAFDDCQPCARVNKDKRES